MFFDIKIDALDLFILSTLHSLILQQRQLKTLALHNWGITMPLLTSKNTAQSKFPSHFDILLRIVMFSNSDQKTFFCFNYLINRLLETVKVIYQYIKFCTCIKYWLFLNYSLCYRKSLTLFTFRAALNLYFKWAVKNFFTLIIFIAINIYNESINHLLLYVQSFCFTIKAVNVLCRFVFQF